MLTRKKFLASLKKQREIEGNSSDLDLLEKVVDIATTASELNALVKIKFHRYGKNSFDCYRFYYPSELLLGLREHFQKEFRDLF